jgi:hypothetical protein
MSKKNNRNAKRATSTTATFALPEGTPTGGQWFAAIGSKGIVLAVGQATLVADLPAVIPAFHHTGEAVRDAKAVRTGEDIACPWSGKGNASGADMGAYVGTRAERITLLPLAEALAKGLVVPASGTLAGSAVDCFLPAGWEASQRLPQYVGTVSNGARGRFEPYSHPDPRRRGLESYGDIHRRPVFAPAKEGAK